MAPESGKIARRRSILAICLPTLLVSWPSLTLAASLALRDDRYLQVILAPLMCSFLIFQNRTEIFSRARYSPRAGIPMLLLAMLLGITVVYRENGSDGARLSVALIPIVFAWLAAFFLCYGASSFRAAVYPLSCLFLMIPLPASWMDWVAAGLQHGSASLSYEILRISGVPVFRQGMVFSLPRLDFEVAPECSGIRSSLALLTVAIIAGYICLRAGWARLALLVLTVPIALFKNAVRIVSISLLGAYVDRVYVDGPFHHQYGGLLFTIVGITLFVAVLAGLRNVERWRQGQADAADRGSESLASSNREALSASLHN